MRDMRKNQKGRIAAIKQGGELGKRLRDMGLVPGTEITVQKRAPLYDPVALRVMGGVVSLRNNEADFIEVDVDGGEAA
ncbi:MAG: ferrous iron transport protein A [Desulfurivibrionaceae bacterium]